MARPRKRAPAHEPRGWRSGAASAGRAPSPDSRPRSSAPRALKHLDIASALKQGEQWEPAESGLIATLHWAGARPQYQEARARTSAQPLFQASREVQPRPPGARSAVPAEIRRGQLFPGPRSTPAVAPRTGSFWTWEEEDDAPGGAACSVGDLC